MKKNTRVPVRNFMFTNFKVLVTVLFLAGIFHYSQVASAGVAKTETNIPEADLVWAVSPPESVPSNQELLVCTTPGTPVASGTTTICSGSSTNISATSTNATAIYWYTGGCGTTQVGTSLPGANFGVSPATTTTYYARGYNSSGGCFSTSCTSITITVATRPLTPAVSPTSATICSGGSASITANSTNATNIYWYTGSCGGVLVGSCANNTGMSLTPATTTTYYARGYNSSGGCFSTSCTSITITVATRPLTPTVSPTSATICSGGSASITANSTNATNIYWYTGSCGGVLVGSCANNTVMSLTPATTTTYYARGYNSSGGCFSTSCTSITITVNTPPLTPTVSPTSATICSGGSASITANSSNATSIYWYTGSCGGVFVGSCANNTSMPFTPSSTTTYYARGYSTSGGCFSTSCASITVTVSPQPLTPVISPSSATICPGGSASITANSTNAASIYWFSVSCGGVFVGSCTNNTSMTLTPATTTTYYARGYSGSGCVSTGCGSITVTIGTVPGAVTVSGGGTFCNTATLNATGGSGGTIYWQGTSSAGTSTATPSTSQVVTTSGTYYFRASNNCGWGTEGSATVVINLPPVQPGAITGSADVPAGAIQTYSIAPVTGATSYNWTVPTSLGWVINSGQGTTSINVTTGSASGPVCVTAHNNCGDSPEKCLDIFCDITENIGIEKFNIYPNPSDGMFLIEMEIAKSQDITIKVFDVIGHVVYQNSIHDFSGQYSKLIDISKNAKGTYNLQITTGEGAVNRKIVIQ